MPDFARGKKDANHWIDRGQKKRGWWWFSWDVHHDILALVILGSMSIFGGASTFRSSRKFACFSLIPPSILKWPVKSPRTVSRVVTSARVMV